MFKITSNLRVDKLVKKIASKKSRDLLIRLYAEEIAEESDLTLSFGYTILNDTVLPDDYNEEALGQYLGDLLMVAIQNGMQDGTAVLNEREPE